MRPVLTKLKKVLCLKVSNSLTSTLSNFAIFISGIQIGKEKFTYESHDVDHDLYDAIKNMAFEKLQYALDTDDKNVRDERIGEITDEIIPALEEQFPDINEQIGEILYKMQKEIVRAWLVQGRRVDGRGLDEIRPLAAEVDLLPRTHGSGMFTRGQTQVLSVATLAPLSEIQKLDGIDLEETKRYIHHYNFPSYSVGETRPSRGPGRREIGHGALAERSLVPVLPSRRVPICYQSCIQFFFKRFNFIRQCLRFLHLHLWQQAFLLKPLLQVSLAVL